MIGSIAGTITHAGERDILIEVGGIGYIIAVPAATKEHAQEGDTIRLFTHLSVREDALDLYGFERREELAFFKLLIGISGIGPKSALNILSLADIQTLSRAVRGGDVAYLTKVSGIGKKLAAKIVLELKEKVGEAIEGDVELTAEHEAMEALEALGYPPRDTREIVHALARDHKTTQEIIRSALQQLGRQ
jgi:Holliday junction DNA helicase RuvA